jgi:hypothetical protein
MNTDKQLNHREVDFIEELRLRRWAREHHVPPSQREREWHPVVHDEMNRKDTESLDFSAR